MNAPYYFHPAGFPSRWGVIDVGLRCFHHCAMCFTLYMDGTDVPGQGMKNAKFHSKETILGMVDALADNGFLGFCTTGGEPALHPNIVEMVARATERGIASRIITLGQYLGRPMHKLKGNLIDELLAAGLTDFRLSVHEVDEHNFKELTGGSWAKQKANMDYLDSKGFQFMSNTTVTLRNFKRLPSIARELATHGVYNSTLLFMMAHYEHAQEQRAARIQSSYTEAAKYAREFVSILEDAKIPVITRYAPLCTIAGIERTHSGAIGVRYDPHEWMNAIDHKCNPATATPEIVRAMGARLPQVPGAPSDGLELLMAGPNSDFNGIPVVAGRGRPDGISKLFPKQCEGCSAMPVCDGMEPQYLERFGGKEFVPYLGENRGNVIDFARAAYRPSYYVKLKPDADIKSAIAREFQPTRITGSPRVSIIVTCYNYGQYLAECLTSVDLQTYDNIEVIIVDDGSTDNTREVAHEFIKDAYHDQSRPWTYYHQPNSGQPAYPRNKGIELSTGELIICLDADDILMPTYVEECVQALKENPIASIAYTGVTCFGDSDAQWQAPNFDGARLLMQNFITCASMFKKSMWKEVGGYKTYCRGAEDFNFWVQAVGLGHVGVPVPRQLWKYRVHSDGIFLSDVVPNFEEKYRQIVLNNVPLYPPIMVQQAKDGGKITRAVA